MSLPYDNIPSLLKQRPNWVVWGVRDAPMKAPFEPTSLLSGRPSPAKAGICDTWSSYQAGDYLLDDYTKNLASWNPAQGIKLLNGINHTHGTCQGNRIRCDKPPSTLARNIAQIVEFGEAVWDDKPKTQSRTQREKLYV